MVRYQILRRTRKKPYRNVSCITLNRLFPCCTQNSIAYCCSCKHSLSFIAKYTDEVAHTHFVLTADVTQCHTNLISHNLHERWTMNYCFSSRCFHIVSVLPLRTVWNILAFICLLSYFFNNRNKLLLLPKHFWFWCQKWYQLYTFSKLPKK